MFSWKYLRAEVLVGTVYWSQIRGNKRFLLLYSDLLFCLGRMFVTFENTSEKSSEISGSYSYSNVFREPVCNITQIIFP